ncbi:MAG: 4-hydroxy-3-methylbut-2-enyl diphosphate reductase [Candidatus Omnitrophota bacterium]|nr:4-hydroxy-3-methylbut-2-enyl diphosphate reductase [Candidatus Omnitrophota bacterium]
MKIDIAKSSGFCFGVRRAIEKANGLAGRKREVYVLGDIVHNSFVVRELEEKGIKKLRKIRPAGNSTLIIRAHGAPKKVFERAKSCGFRVVDATCPMVKDIYRIARKLEKNNTIIIIGDTGHDEVKGIAGQLKKRPVTIESPRDIPVKRLKRVKKAAVITQSTQSLDNINRILERLEKIIPRVKLYNTTCRTTRVKQREIKSLPQRNDLVLIIGSKTSANTKRLYQISKGINKNTRWIESVKDLKSAWFKKIKKVGIMAGASTPDYITGEVVDKLSSEATKDLKRNKQWKNACPG